MPRRRKNENEIVYVQTSEGNSYFAFDYYESEFGKRKRIYAETKEKLEEKLQHIKEEEERRLLMYLPKNSMLKDWCEYYFRSLIGKSSAGELKRIVELFKSFVYGTDIDRDMTEITVDDMNRFYLIMQTKYDIKSVIKVDEVIRKIFLTANEHGIKTFDFSEIPVPEKIVSKQFNEVPSNYIPSAAEMELMLNQCMTSTSFGTLAWVISFALMTGIPLPRIAELTNKDFDFENKTVKTKKGIVPMDDKCIEWLKSVIVKKNCMIDKESPESPYPITCYSLSEKLPSGCTPDEIIAYMAEHTEIRNEFVKEYMNLKPDDFMFISRKNSPVCLSNVQRILRTVAAKCNIPKGITGKSLHKAYIVAELNKGKSPELLKARYGYKKESDILEIKADYDVRNMLL